MDAGSVRTIVICKSTPTMWHRTNGYGGHSWRHWTLHAVVIAWLVGSWTSFCAIAQAENAKIAAGAAPTVYRTFRVREQDQVWVVSTRHLGCTGAINDLPALQFCRYEQGWWQPKSAAAFVEEQPADGVTAFYIHGNQIGHPQACSDGLAVYFQLAGKFDDELPVRFVIWSWPSEKIRGPINDARSKGARADSEALYLARFLEELTPEGRVGLAAYSLGARIVSGALHDIGGRSPATSRAETRFRVALWAAAEHNHWYQPGQFHQHALGAADAWFTTVNGCDPVLSRYRFIEKCSDPTAVGNCGIYGRNLLPPDVNERVEEVNVANIVGKSHDMECYLYAQWIQDRTREYVLWHAVAAAHVAVAEGNAAE